MKKYLVLLLCILVLSACSSQDNARQDAVDKASDRKYYVMENDVEYKIYERRQKLADDPTTILWCTSAFPIPSSPIFTVPVVGKLTSGSKRPFPDEPGPDSMYGSSGDYRYGFTPAGIYADWYGMSTFCTTEPTVWQRESTTIVSAADPELFAAHEQARIELKAGNTAEANRILQNAINKIK